MVESKQLENKQEEPAYRWKSLPVNPFKRGVLFFVGPKEMLLKTLKENYKGYEETIDRVIKEDGVTEGDYALGYTFKVLPDALVWCPNEPTVSVAVHELVHCVYHILKQVEIPMTDDTEELVAYLIEYLTDEFVPWIKKENCE